MKALWLVLISLVAVGAHAAQLDVTPIKRNGAVIGARMSTVLEPLRSSVPVRVTLVAEESCPDGQASCEVAVLSAHENLATRTQVVYDVIYGQGNQLTGGETLTLVACGQSRCNSPKPRLTLPR
jgi:hypothetical protein